MVLIKLYSVHRHHSSFNMAAQHAANLNEQQLNCYLYLESESDYFIWENSFVADSPCRVEIEIQRERKQEIKIKM